MNNDHTKPSSDTGAKQHGSSTGVVVASPAANIGTSKAAPSVIAEQPNSRSQSSNPFKNLTPASTIPSKSPTKKSPPKAPPTSDTASSEIPNELVANILSISKTPAASDRQSVTKNPALKSAPTSSNETNPDVKMSEKKKKKIITVKKVKKKKKHALQSKTASGVLAGSRVGVVTMSADTKTSSKFPATATHKSPKLGSKQQHHSSKVPKHTIGIHKHATHSSSSNGGDSPGHIVNSVGRIIRRRRRWTSQELTLFELGLSIYDRDYDKIASLVKTRSTRQIRRHANYHLHKIRQQESEQPGGGDDDSMVVYSDDEDRQRAGEFGHYDEALHEVDLVDYMPRGLDQYNADQRRNEGGTVSDAPGRPEGEGSHRASVRSPLNQNPLEREVAKEGGSKNLSPTDSSLRDLKPAANTGDVAKSGDKSLDQSINGNQGMASGSTIVGGQHHVGGSHDSNQRQPLPPFMETMEISCGQDEFVQNLIAKNWKTDMVGSVILLSPPPY